MKLTKSNAFVLKETLDQIKQRGLNTSIKLTTSPTVLTVSTKEGY